MTQLSLSDWATLKPGNQNPESGIGNQNLEWDIGIRNPETRNHKSQKTSSLHLRKLFCIAFAGKK